MTHEDYMQEAIKVARESEQAGGVAIGAIMVKNDKIISTGTSSVWPDKDPSGHGECNAIRKTCQVLDAVDLKDCILYGTLEPCGMCLSCAAWASLSTLYFGAYRDDASANKYEILNWSAESAAKNMQVFDGTPMHVQGGILREECAALLQDYKDWSKQA